MSIRIGIDVGGTFTDFLVIYPDGKRRIHKTSSVPSNPPMAVQIGLAEIATAENKTIEDFMAEVGLIVHGTTVTTNALLTRNGPTTGLLTTEGFRDVLPMRDGTREEAYDNRLEQPVPLVPRYLRQPVAGRVDYKGDVLTALKEEDVYAAAEIFKANDVESVAISFMHSHAETSHEDRAAEIIAEVLPGAYITKSSELLAQARYYPRMSTAVLNSYAGPIISSYLSTLTELLEEVHFSGILLLMQSNGGVATPGELAKRAALSLLSGPASGPTAGLLVTAAHGWDSCLTVDMGGTSFDAAVVKDNKPLIMTDGIIDRWRIALPMVDINTIGAGGGSIASVDEGGLLRVGPQSAGATPGPACYRRGGVNATVTDADVVLGYIDPDTFLHGQIGLDREASIQAIKNDVADPLGITVEEAAFGIYQMVNVNMATGVRDITVRRGLDPRDFPIVVAGGAGPVHAGAIARELEIPILLTPRDSSIFCAAGMLVCDFKHDYVQSSNQRLESLSDEYLVDTWKGMMAEGRKTLHAEGVADAAISYVPSVDLRYKGQWYEINVEVDPANLVSPNIAEFYASFHKLHDTLFGYSTLDMPIDLLNIRLTVVGTTPNDRVDLAATAAGAIPEHRRRDIYSPLQRQMVEVEVYQGAAMVPLDEIEGPAIIELGTTTIVVLDEYNTVVDKNGSFVMYLRDQKDTLKARLDLS
ncbi:hydantoinase/oxoprolinase family protein [Cryobacterium sp. PH29-G1]|uniref:hydantoinase/oxoprolinase family protein n=1 Tax=Cryobacterium sp. PH29-G1 TaxID=3046211 RepID=UPI0024B87B45|nr:hydantoinase/oxoprolinase family protein [Cryobacterium sp. PH29-G1]MDJ0349589.1 hydantoinase/oxoprolinase family protein [Cryobacterium sp. PH29-G1]